MAEKPKVKMVVPVGRDCAICGYYFLTPAEEADHMVIHGMVNAIAWDMSGGWGSNAYVMLQSDSRYGIEYGDVVINPVRTAEYELVEWTNEEGDSPHDSIAEKEDMPGYAAWRAAYQYPLTDIYKAWDAALSMQPLTHERFVHLMEDSYRHVTPTEYADSASVVDILRTMRVTLKSDASSSFNDDGSTNLTFQRSAQIRGSKEGETKLPSQLNMSIPLFDTGNTLLEFEVRLRANATDDRGVLLSLSSLDFRVNRDKILKAHADEAHAKLGDFDSPMLHVVK